MKLAMVELRQLKKWLQKLLDQFLSEGARFTPFLHYIGGFPAYSHLLQTIF